MSGTINNGGPAFPTPVCEEPHCEVCESKSAGTGIFFGGTQGMTMRDYFAAKSLPIAWAAYDQGYTGQPECVEQSIAHHAYQIADAMLRARESK